MRITFKTMPLQEFSAAIKDLKNSMDDLPQPTEEGSTLIYDGPIDDEQYYNAPIRITWLLKEAYDEDGDGWDYGDGFFPEDIYSFISGHKSKNTWQPIAYASFAILNGFPTFNDMANLSEEPQMAKVINQIAVVNTKKYSGKTQSHDREIEAAFYQNRELLKRQLAVLSPDIIIGGKTLHLYLELLGLTSPAGMLPNTKRPYYINNGKLFIDAYHPARRGSWFHYVDDLVLTARKWYEDYRLFQ